MFRHSDFLSTIPGDFFTDYSIESLRHHAFVDDSREVHSRNV